MNSNDYHQGDRGGGRGEHTRSTTQWDPVEVGQASANRPVARPVARPVVRPVPRDPVADGAPQMAVGGRRVPGPGQPVHIPNLRGPQRRPSDTSAPPRPPRSPPTPPPGAPPAPAPAPAAATVGENGSPDTSVHSSTAVGSDKAKQVFFATTDKHHSVSDKYTFYREPTPPPLPPPPMDFGSGAYNDAHRGAPPSSSTAGADFYDYKYDHVAPQAPIPRTETRGPLCGLRRRVFWAIFAAVLLILAIAVGVGVGVGVGASNGSSNDEPDSQASDPTNTATTTATTTMTSAIPSTTSLPAATSADPSLPTATTKLACPDANDTLYDIPSSPKTFKRFCGIDYDGSAQARDIGSVWTATMEDCMINCAGFPGCEACGWGAIRGDPGSDHRCWLKNNLQDENVKRTGWQFAVLQ